MKICCYTDTFFPIVGGAEMVLHNLSNQLSHFGDEVHIFAPRFKGVSPEVESSYHVHRYPNPFSKRYLVRKVLLPLAWLHLRHHFDILHCHSGYPPGYVGITFKKWFKVPVLVRPHGSDIVPGDRIRRYPKLTERLKFALRSADAVVAQGQYLKELILTLGVDSSKVHIIHNGVNLNDFAGKEPFSHPRPYILALGNLIFRKGFDILLHAYSSVAEPKPDLLIAGPGREEKMLKALAKEMGIEHQVKFIGFIDGQKKINLFRSAEFFICPSRKEPFANVLIEAMSAGLPVIASSIDGNKELIIHEKNGLLFPSENSEALKDAMQRLISEDGLADRMRSVLPGFAKDFDWPIVARKYRELYAALVGASSRNLS
ncbi:MAG: glycosyltransferase family 4 protein [Deltaproteobacteria bacterium]|nr:glycosyltransferase family 4 protein [Deltaproteobacteria bacterium]MBW2181090.1 glycosyltransferase family 4 protein [Deltaproteobacteria bacterium]